MKRAFKEHQNVFKDDQMIDKMQELTQAFQRNSQKKLPNKKRLYQKIIRLLESQVDNSESQSYEKSSFSPTIINYMSKEEPKLMRDIPCVMDPSSSSKMIEDSSQSKLSSQGNRSPLSFQEVNLKKQVLVDIKIQKSSHHPSQSSSLQGVPESHQKEEQSQSEQSDQQDKQELYEEQELQEEQEEQELYEEQEQSYNPEIINLRSTNQKKRKKPLNKTKKTIKGRIMKEKRITKEKRIPKEKRITKEKPGSRGRKPVHPKLQKGLIKWIHQQLDSGNTLRITQKMIREKALRMNKHQLQKKSIEGIPTFHASKGWVERFLNRNPELFKKIYSKSFSTESYQTNETGSEVLKEQFISEKRSF